MGSDDSDSEYDPEEEAAVPGAPPPPPPPGAPSPAAADEMYDPFAGAAEDDAGYCFEAEDEEDEAQVQLREQAAAAMKQRDLKLSLQAKEVHFRSRLFFGPFRLPRG